MQYNHRFGWTLSFRYAILFTKFLGKKRNSVSIKGEYHRAGPVYEFMSFPHVLSLGLSHCNWVVPPI